MRVNGREDEENSLDKLISIANDVELFSIMKTLTFITSERVKER